MGYTTPVTAVAGQNLSAANWNTTVRDSLEAVAKPPMCKLIRTTAWAGTVPSATPTNVVFSSAKWDGIPAFWSAANPTRLTIPVAGKYELKGGFYMSGTTGTYRGLLITKFNAAGVLQGQPGLDFRTPGAVVINNASCEDSAIAGDYYTLQVQQDTGVAQGLALFNLEGYCFFSAKLISY